MSLKQDFGSATTYQCPCTDKMSVVDKLGHHIASASAADRKEPKTNFVLQTTHLSFI